MTAPFRQDGYVDALAAAGERLSRARERRAVDHLAAELYATDPLARAIVDKIAEDAMSRGFAIAGDEDGRVLSEWTRVNGGPVFTDALCRARLDGVAYVLMLTADGGSLSAPLLPEGTEEVRGIVALSRNELRPGDLLYADPAQLNYMQPVSYVLADERQTVVHESRVLVFTLQAPRHRGQRNLFHDGGVLGPVMPQLDLYNEAHRLIQQIAYRKQQAIYAMSGMADELALPGGEARVGARIDYVDGARSLLNMVATDADDRFEVRDLSLGGVDTLMSVRRAGVAAAARYPQAVLFGEDIKGLGSTGTGEQGIYHGTVGSFQNLVVRPPLERFIAVLYAQRALRADEPDEWDIRFEPLWSPSAKETAEAAKAEEEAKLAKVRTAQALRDGRMVDDDELREWARRTFPEFEMKEGLPDIPEPEDFGLPGEGDPNADSAGGSNGGTPPGQRPPAGNDGEQRRGG